MWHHARSDLRDSYHQRLPPDLPGFFLDLYLEQDSGYLRGRFDITTMYYPILMLHLWIMQSGVDIISWWIQACANCLGPVILARTIGDWPRFKSNATL